MVYYILKIHRVVKQLYPELQHDPIYGQNTGHLSLAAKRKGWPVQTTRVYISY